MNGARSTSSREAIATVSMASASSSPRSPTRRSRVNRCSAVQPDGGRGHRYDGDLRGIAERHQRPAPGVAGTDRVGEHRRLAGVRLQRRSGAGCVHNPLGAGDRGAQWRRPRDRHASGTLDARADDVRNALGGVGSRTALLEGLSTSLGDRKFVLTEQKASLEDVDPASAAIELDTCSPGIVRSGTLTAISRHLADLAARLPALIPAR